MNEIHPELGPLSNVGGFDPLVRIVVGQGYPREEVKDFLFSQGISLGSSSVQSALGFASEIAGLPEDRILGATARQEILRALMEQKEVQKHLSTLVSLQGRNRFYEKLDRAFQSGRLSCAHEGELQVIQERLAERGIENPFREEVQILSHAYEVYLQSQGWLDPPMIYRKAIECLEAGEQADSAFKILKVNFGALTNLQNQFWEEVSRHFMLVDWDSLKTKSATPPHWRWERWHSIDDAAEQLVDELCQLEPQKWASRAIVIPDDPSIRRSLYRALGERGIPLLDPRDPVFLKLSEAVKDFILPLQVVAEGFDRDRVVEWIQSRKELTASSGEWIRAIYERGVRRGLSSYRFHPQLYKELGSLEKKLGGKKKLEDLAEVHLDLCQDLEEKLLTFIEGLWEEWQKDLVKAGREDQRKELRYWIHLLQERVSQATPPIDLLKPRYGVRLYRLQQVAFVVSDFDTDLGFGKPEEVIFLGMPSRFFDLSPAGDYWFSAREREVLASEFGLISAQTIRSDRLASVNDWIHLTDQVTFLDASYNWDGSERESILPALRELEGFPLDLEKPIERGAHNRFLPSYGTERPLPPTQVRLSSLRNLSKTKEQNIVEATTLDQYSKCPFLGLVYRRWKLEDLRRPEAELWPEVRGNLLHKAVELLLDSRDEAGQFQLSQSQALELAWEFVARGGQPKGFVRSERLEKFVKRRLSGVLSKFCEEEAKFTSRAQTQVFKLEDRQALELSYPEGTIRGRPDRIDRNEQGLFIIDNKTSSQLPTGRDILELGYRPQLAFYAIAAQKTYGLPALGAQYVELTAQGNRSKGIFLKEFNGKKPGMLTATTARSASLIDMKPDEVWSTCEEHLKKDLKSYLEGIYDVAPRKKTECMRCRVADLCGKRRRFDDETD